MRTVITLVLQFSQQQYLLVVTGDYQKRCLQGSCQRHKLRYYKPIFKKLYAKTSVYREKKNIQWLSTLRHQEHLSLHGHMRHQGTPRTPQKPGAPGTPEAP